MSHRSASIRMAFGCSATCVSRVRQAIATTAAARSISRSRIHSAVSLNRDFSARDHRRRGDIRRRASGTALLVPRRNEHVRGEADAARCPGELLAHAHRGRLRRAGLRDASRSSTSVGRAIATRGATMGRPASGVGVGLVVPRWTHSRGSRARPLSGETVELRALPRCKVSSVYVASRIRTA